MIQALTNVKYYKKKLFDKKTEYKCKKVITYVKTDTILNHYHFKLNSSEFSYFSDKNLIIYATNNSQIPLFSNALLVLIDEAIDPKSYFYETVISLYDDFGNKLQTTSKHVLHSNNWISEPLSKFFNSLQQVDICWVS
ncbi:hypothetical protein HYD66_00875 [Mycoplasmopsis bovis]|nr:hypothetical protein [Mycoplasmopsis bovis]QQH55018.1 hypothetical protein HYD66_00875 [Mycoplasmopsis bovis]